jgi:hypothetical protein
MPSGNKDLKTLTPLDITLIKNLPIQLPSLLSESTMQPKLSSISMSELIEKVRQAKDTLLLRSPSK